MNYDFSAIGFVKNVNGNLFVTYADGISQLNKLAVINSHGVITNDYSVDEDIIRMNFISGNKLCVVSTGGVHTIN